MCVNKKAYPEYLAYPRNLFYMRRHKSYIRYRVHERAVNNATLTGPKEQGQGTVRSTMTSSQRLKSFLLAVLERLGRHKHKTCIKHQNMVVNLPWLLLNA